MKNFKQKNGIFMLPRREVLVIGAKLVGALALASTAAGCATTGGGSSGASSSLRAPSVRKILGAHRRLAPTMRLRVPKSGRAFTLDFGTRAVQQEFRNAMADWGRYGGASRSMDEGLLDVLALAGEEFNTNSFQINSGYRTPAHQAMLVERGDGAVNSRHPKGMALDIAPRGRATNARMRAFFGGLGLFTYSKRGFTHVDTGNRG